MDHNIAAVKEDPPFVIGFLMAVLEHKILLVKLLIKLVQKTPQMS